MRRWAGVSAVADTIFEEETEGLNSLSPPLSPPFSSPSTTTPDLQSAVEAWTLARRRRPDVKILVQETCFYLHKDVLSSKSGYLKRHLTEVSELILFPPSKITPGTFELIAEFCYDPDAVIITPFNVAALRTAAELLEMTGTHGGGGESLRQKTESYFCLVVTVNRDFASTVFQSCVPLLPEAEETAFLASRCLEVLCSAEDADGGVVGCCDGIETVRPEDFQIIADSMRRRFTRNHDLIYTAVDLYLTAYNGKISEDQKTQICNSVDCNMLSSQLLMHAVQNPRMPLRFVVQAMLTEQLNTHRSISTAITTSTATRHPSWRHESPADSQDVITLGAILQRDAALRQVAQLKTAMDTTTSRIQSLEKELRSMKKRLIESERRRNTADSGRSVSCRFSKDANGKIERGERGSISSSNLRFKATTMTTTTTTEEKTRSNVEGPALNAESPRLKKNNLGQKLMRGLKSVFRMSSYSISKDSNAAASHSEDEDRNGHDDRVDLIKEALPCVDDGGAIKELVPSHSRTRSR
ncbi:hypothetical protein Nepgr_008197 [Nepenthes gracilis]|uniref:BTB/POZ domain-containing protein n=1 Tax=Nepenthes gracilis TaxID=150966 RepID=A0AAD3XIZ8_NEPGR|nr:hypothetical protein Nepgr_008197 [Nepenthes gracilis]